jgi:hypothetical protein
MVAQFRAPEVGRSFGPEAGQHPAHVVRAPYGPGAWPGPLPQVEVDRSRLNE